MGSDSIRLELLVQRPSPPSPDYRSPIERGLAGMLDDLAPTLG